MCRDRDRPEKCEVQGSGLRYPSGAIGRCVRFLRTGYPRSLCRCPPYQHTEPTRPEKVGFRWMREDEKFKDYSIEREGPGRRPALGRHLLPPNRSSVSREKGMVCKRAENFPFTGGTVRNSGKNRNVKYGCGNVKRMRWCDTVLFGTMKASKTEEESL